MALCAVLVFSSRCGAGPANWPEFRGPTGDGQAGTARVPAVIDPAKHVLWKTPIRGKGWSSPVVWGNQIWLTTATEDGHDMYAIAVDLQSGEVLHDVHVFHNEEPAFCHEMNSYASPTPAIEQGRVYVHFGSYGTACLDTGTGEVLWQRRDLACDHFRGPASSPILYQDLLIVAFDGFDVQYVVAFDKHTGDTVWRKDRQINYGTDNGDLKKAYGTGAIFPVEGSDQLVYPAAVATEAYDPLTGELLWVAYHDGMNASSRPLYSHGLVFITNGMGGMVAVRPDGRGVVTDTHVAWSSSRSIARKTSQVLIGDQLYMVADNGVVSSRDAQTGEIAWQQRLAGEFAASPVVINGLIYWCNMEGTIYTMRPGNPAEIVGQTELGDGFMASPAVAGDRLILRSKSHLYGIGH